ncbi:MAG: hypothetical protein ACI4HQ_01825 [Acetatifactor sp.]
MISNIQFQVNLEQEIQELTELAKKLRLRLVNAPEGTLCISKTGKGKYSQYHIQHQGKRTYLPVSKQELAFALAQKAYDEKALAIIELRLKEAKKLLRKYDLSIEALYSKQSDEKKKLITPIVPTDEMFVKEWYKKHPGSANPYQNNSTIYTERGEVVRSKSEKILADLFFRRNIPYVYEPMMEVGKGKIVYPDFLLLYVKQRKTYIYEHFGMMDHPEYVKNTLEKLSLYSENGYWYGDKLLFSFETSTNPLNTKNVEKMLCHFI